MKAYILRDSKGHIFGHQPDHDKPIFNITNPTYILFQQRSKALEIADVFNSKPMLDLSTPISVVTVEIG
jgi:hypothetical protein